MSYGSVVARVIGLAFLTHLAASVLYYILIIVLAYIGFVSPQFGLFLLALVDVCFVFLCMEWACVRYGTSRSVVAAYLVCVWMWTPVFLVMVFRSSLPIQLMLNAFILIPFALQLIAAVAGAWAVRARLAMMSH